MKLLVTAVFFIGATFVSATLEEKTGEPIAQPAEPSPGLSNHSTCGSKWDDLTSFIGEEVIMKAKDKMMDKAKPCIQTNQPKQLMDMYIKCGMNTFQLVMKDLSDGTTKVPIIDDLKRWFGNYINCCINEFNITTNESLFNRTLFKKIQIEDWTDVAEDKIALRTIFDSCVDAATGSNAFKELFSVNKCIMDGMTMQCKMKGEPEGMTIKVMRAFLTLWDDSPCSGVPFPQKWPAIQITCMEKIEQRWTDKGFSNFTSSNMTKFNSDVKNAMFFLKEYGMNMMGILECGSEGMGFFNSTDGLIDYQAIEVFLSSQEGWNDDTVKDNVVTGLKECVIAHNETASLKMGEMEQDMPFMGQFMQFQECYLPKFIKICGLNSDLSKCLIPILYNDLIVAVAEDFKAKNGVMAIMHIFPAIKEKLSPVLAAMNMTMYMMGA